MRIGDKPLKGYQNHIGRSQGPDRAHLYYGPGAEDEGEPSTDGPVMTRYLHCMSADDGFLAGLAALSLARHLDMACLPEGAR